MSDRGWKIGTYTACGVAGLVLFMLFVGIACFIGVLIYGIASIHTGP